MFDNKLMSGKKGLVMGVANDRSISWAIAKKAYEYGAELAFTYQGDALGKRVIPLGESVGSNIILPCEVSEASSIKNVFEKEKWKIANLRYFNPIGANPLGGLNENYSGKPTNIFPLILLVAAKKQSETLNIF